MRLAKDFRDFLKSYFMDDPSIFMIILVALVILAINIGSFFIIHDCTYTLILIVGYLLFISTDACVVFYFLGYMFGFFMSLVPLCIIGIVDAYLWGLLYIIIRIFCFAFHYNYMNYNFSVLQWFAIWLVCMVGNHICTSTNNDNSNK